MKKIKKISLVYTLQVMAVILLFGYAVVSPEKETIESAPDRLVPSGYIKPRLIINDKDSVLTGSNNAIWNHTTKTR